MIFRLMGEREGDLSPYGTTVAEGDAYNIK